ncbi:MAG: hypothetical protein M9899_02410 [Bdellovibrionaceae bacterium]|nr:hypothetical protein [Pseudobdellovibrionaceae bacterium]
MGTIEEIRLKISQAISDAFKPKNIKEQSDVESIADKLAQNIFGYESTTTKFNRAIDEALKTSYTRKSWWEYQQASGLGAVWEFHIKMMVELYGVETRKLDDRNRKQRNTDMLPFKDLSEIISDFQEKTKKRFKLNLTNFSEIRSAMIHGNFDQLRILLSNGSKMSESVKGNVIALKGDQVFSLSENLKAEEKNQVSTYGWFLEGANSDSIDLYWIEIAKSLRQINLVIDLVQSSHTSEETQKLFQQIIDQGILPTLEEQKHFLPYFKTFGFDEKHVERYFQDLKLIINVEK